MPSPILQPPTLSRHGAAVRLIYELPHRVYDAKLYPVKSSNGSSVILYGHDEGFTIIWRGGRLTESSSNAAARSSSQSEDVMIIDLEEEPTTNQDAHLNNGNYYQDEEDRGPYEPFIATRDITLKTCVLSLAVPPLPSDTASRDSVPSVLVDRIVFTAACADQTVRLFSLPLEPNGTNHVTEISSTDGEEDVQCRVIVDPHLHGSNARGVAFSYTYIPARRDGWNSDEDEGNPGNLADRNPTGDDIWQLLVASHAADPTPTLAITRLSFPADDKSKILNNAQISIDALFPENTGINLAFNTARYPTKRHSRLLFAEASGVVRLYDTLTLKRKYLGRPTFVNPDVPPEVRTSLIASFYAPFQRASDPIAQAFGLRHRILDAQWVLDGSCIIILIDDRRWGIWDFAEAGPRMLKTGRSSGDQYGTQSTPDTGITAFSLQGFLPQESLDEFSRRTYSAKEKGAPGPQNLGPMTPRSRKLKQTNLFNPHSGGLPSHRQAAGKVNVSSYTSSGAVRDESIVMCYEGLCYVITSLKRIWELSSEPRKTDAKKSSPNILHAAPVTLLQGMSTLGEQITSISQDSKSYHQDFSDTGPDIIVSAEHRLVLWCPMKPQRQAGEQLQALFNQPNRFNGEQNAIQLIDEDRLFRNELDLEGIDRVIGNMSTGRSRPARVSNGSPVDRRQQLRSLAQP